MKNQKNATSVLISLLNSFMGALNKAYPDKELSLPFAYTNLWDAPDGKLYLWATMEDANNLKFFPTDTEEIDDAGICTRELTTPEGLTIIIAEDF